MTELQTFKRILNHAGLALAGVAAWGNGVTILAQDYPARPVRFVVGFAPGGSNDTLARIVAQKLTETWGQNVVVDNRPGAGATLAAHLVVKAIPDGYTVFAGDIGPNVVARSLFPNLPYDPADDFAHVIRMVTFPLVLVVPAASPLANVKDLIEAAKSRPGKMTYTTSGAGTSPHLFTESMNLMANISMAAIHYRGGAPALVGLLAGEGDFTLTSVTTALAQLGAGRVRAIGVTSANSIPRMPNVPPIANALPGYDAITFYGLHAPARTPKHVVAKLNREVARVLLMPDVKERLDVLAMDVAAGTPEEFTAFVKKQITLWTAVVQTAKIRGD